MRGLISLPVWKSIESNCAGNITFLTPPAPCQTALNAAQQEMGDKFNPYDLAVDMCPSDEQVSIMSAMFKMVS